MRLSQSQQQVLQHYMNSHGMQNQSLKSDLLDHLSCKVEELMDEEKLGFEEALERAQIQSMPNGPQEFERDLKLLTTQKSTIMIRKIAFLGGYVSALCLCLSILFFALSSFENKKNALRMNSAQMEYELQENNHPTAFHNHPIYKNMVAQSAESAIVAYRQYSRAEKLLMASIFLLVTTFLPYLFFAGYRKQSPEVEPI